MLTTKDLELISELLNRELTPIRHKLNIMDTNIQILNTKVHKLDKKLDKIDSDLQVTIRFFDNDHIQLEKRVTRIEQRMGFEK